MNRPSRQRALRKVGLSSAIAATVLVSGVGEASASTHSLKSVHPSTFRGSKDASTTTPPPTPSRGPGGVGGDVNALTSTSISIVNLDGTATSYDSSSTTIEATTVGIGMPGPGNGPGPHNGAGYGPTGHVPFPGVSGAGVGSNARGVRAK